MEHQLSIIVGTDPARVAQAEILDAPQFTPYALSGKLVNVPLLDILKFDSSENVTVLFKGRQYTFSWLEKNGTFKLCRD
jgi:hypothetical protein